MSKKLKTKKSKFSFAHPSRHGKLHWKKVLFIILFGSFGLVIAAAVVAQVFYNRFVWDRLSENSSLKITLLIQSALEGLDELKSSPEKAADNTLLIKEVRLRLPAETDNVRKLLYFHNPPDTGTDGSGYNWDIPQTVQITTKQLSMLSRNRILAGSTTEDVFNFVPEAQACNRGFLLQFVKDNSDGLLLSGQVSLSDGRILYIYREPGCKSYTEMVDSFEEYLLKADSY